MSKVIEGKLTAWISSSSIIGPHNINDVDDTGLFTYTSSRLDMAKHGYTKVGHAEVRLALADADTLVDSKIDALNAEIVQIEGAAEARVTQLKHQIQQLLAITHQPEK